MAIPSTSTVNRILVRQGLVVPRKRKRPRESYLRWQRPGPMQLWQIDIVGGVWLVDPVTGVVREAKVVTGVDDHSRFCVIAAVVERATGRAVCLAFAAALARFGVPEEVLTDNGKQFTDRFGKGGEVLFDKICRHNGITHRLTQPASPTTTGKIERFHLTLRRELLDDHDPFESLEAAQAAVDAFVDHTTPTGRTRRSTRNGRSAPADRFAPVPEEERELLPLWLPPTLTAAPTAAGAGQSPMTTRRTSDDSRPVAVGGWPGRARPGRAAVGEHAVAGRQFWLGPARSGQVVRFWADVDLIHLFIGGTRVKTVRSHLTVTDLARLVAEGAVNAGPSPLPPVEPGDAVEVERVVSRGGIVVPRRPGPARRGDPRRPPGRDPDRARHVMFFDLDTRELLRVRPNPLSPDKITRLRGNRPAGPPPDPRPSRSASNAGPRTPA